MEILYHEEENNRPLPINEDIRIKIEKLKPKWKSLV